MSGDSGGRDLPGLMRSGNAAKSDAERVIHSTAVPPVTRRPRNHNLSNSKCNPSRTAPAAAPLNLPVHSTSSALSTVRI